MAAVQPCARQAMDASPSANPAPELPNQLTQRGPRNLASVVSESHPTRVRYDMRSSTHDLCCDAATRSVSTVATAIVEDPPAVLG
jgi:hypothetical protein